MADNVPMHFPSVGSSTSHRLMVLQMLMVILHAPGSHTLMRACMSFKTQLLLDTVP